MNGNCYRSAARAIQWVSHSLFVRQYFTPSSANESFHREYCISWLDNPRSIGWESYNRRHIRETSDKAIRQVQAGLKRRENTKEDGDESR